MNSLEEWQRAQNSGIHERSLCRRSDAGQRLPISADISASVGFPPWPPRAKGPAAEMDVAHDLGEMEVGVRVALLARLEENPVRQVRVRVAEDAVVAQDQLHLAVVDVQGEERCQMGRRGQRAG